MGLQTIVSGGKTFQLDNSAGTWTQFYYLTPDQNTNQVTKTTRAAYPGVTGASVAISVGADPNYIQTSSATDSWLYNAKNDLWINYTTYKQGLANVLNSPS